MNEEIMTADELMALPVGSVVLDAFAAQCTKDDQGWSRVTPAVNEGRPYRRRPYLPGELLREGGVA